VSHDPYNPTQVHSTNNDPNAGWGFNSRGQWSAPGQWGTQVETRTQGWVQVPKNVPSQIPTSEVVGSRTEGDPMVTGSNASASTTSSSTTPVESQTTPGATPVTQTPTQGSPVPGIQPQETVTTVEQGTQTPTQGSPVPGIQPQETVTTVEQGTPLTFGTLQVTRAVVGTDQRDVITGSDAGEALAGGKGKDQMTGGGGPDAFLFETHGEFGKESSDTVTDFDPDKGDKMVISKDAFEGVNKVKLDVASGKKDAKNSASSNKTFIYDEKSGVLYFNENGKKDGFGDGGEFVKLLGAPELSKSDFVIV
jgi:hypothetical protein